MLDRLAASFATDQAGVLLAVAKTGSDIAEFSASGQIDDSLPLVLQSHLWKVSAGAVVALAGSVLVASAPS